MNLKKKNIEKENNTKWLVTLITANLKKNLVLTISFFTKEFLWAIYYFHTIRKYLKKVTSVVF